MPRLVLPRCVVDTRVARGLRCSPPTRLVLNSYINAVGRSTKTVDVVSEGTVLTNTGQKRPKLSREGRTGLGQIARRSQATPSPKRNFFFSSRRRHTRFDCDWSSDVCSSD